MLQKTERIIRTDTMGEINEILRGVRLLNPLSGFDGIVDVALERDRIKWIRKTSDDPSGLWLFPGIVDMHVHLRTPGYQKAESLETGLRAAVAGGVTSVGMMPNTTPCLDSLASVIGVKELGESLGLAEIYPVPCVTEGRAGKVCVDFEGFAGSGITCFSDDGSPVESETALSEAFQSIALFDGVVIEHPEITSMAAGGAVNQGRASKQTGVVGIPESAEYLDVERCIGVLRDSNSGARLHLTHLSSPESVRLAYKASQEGLRVTCDVTPHHLALNEEAVIAMGAVAKMNPPLRSEESRKKIVEMIRNGMVTAIASDHAPHTAEKKDRPLSEAAFGITGLETLLSVTMDILAREAGMKPIDIIRLITSAPAGILHSAFSDIAPGKPLNMVLFQPELQWEYSSTFSRSSNSPFLGKTLTGKVLRVWRKRELYREGEFV
ncbi:MAG: dihydroorotase [Candidatus Fermentibacteria bacterium]|nr:dihydroorotase [Candidatus Fermentibacteria bacterium]